MNEKIKIKDALKESLEGKVQVDDMTLQKIVNKIHDDLHAFQIDVRWLDHLEVRFDEEYQEISVVLGPRDMQFNLNGEKVASGFCLFPIDLPWEKTN